MSNGKLAFTLKHSGNSHGVMKQDSELIDHVLEHPEVPNLFDEFATSRFEHMKLKQGTVPATDTQTTESQKPKDTKTKKYTKRPPIPEHLRDTTKDHKIVQIQQGEGALDLIRSRTGNK